jgi:hypothetical protein
LSAPDRPGSHFSDSFAASPIETPIAASSSSSTLLILRDRRMVG